MVIYLLTYLFIYLLTYLLTYLLVTSVMHLAESCLKARQLDVCWLTVLFFGWARI